MAAVHEVREAWGSKGRGRTWAACAALLGTMLLAALWQAANAASGALIPIPASITLTAGQFTVAAGTLLQAAADEPEAQAAASYFAGLVRRSRGLSLPVRASSSGRGAIRFERCDGLGAEAYRLEIKPAGITVTASSASGLFYGAVTLWELLPTGHGGAQLQAQRIEDQPVYPWRGLMLDSARHFQSPQFVKSMLEWMAWHKLNVLHWHLTDDQGWRLQIRKYPRLTAIGAWRTPASVGATVLPAYGGFYTQQQVRDIVAFAATRHIMVVPEIDMPGHAQAAISAYPALGSLEGPAPPVSARWGVHTYLYNLEPQTFTFLEDVLSEVMELFPAPYVHLGGDEAVKDQWRASAQVQARARELGIVDPDALQGYFTQHMGQFLAAHGRRMIGWDEILRPELASDAVVMAWHGSAGAHVAALAGHDAVLTPWPTFYFDNRQSALPDEPPGRTRIISLEDVYRFEPRDATLNGAQQQHILGVQGNLWTEHIRTEERLEWMALPRAAAIAELGWSAPERRDWSDFLMRLAASLPRYQSLGLHAADSAFAVDAHLAQRSEGIEVTLGNQAHVGQIHYTLDGSEPVITAALYTTPVAVEPGSEMRAATFIGNEQVSHTWAQRIDSRTLNRRDSRQLELCTDAVGLLLEPRRPVSDPADTVAIDIMNPCWWYRGVTLDRGARLTAAVTPLPFNYELGDELKKIRVGHTQTPFGELEIHIDTCSSTPAALMPLGAMVAPAVLAPTALAPQPGVHDLCLRMTRPTLEPLWALDWLEIAE
jgi:hexosaminidase